MAKYGKGMFIDLEVAETCCPRELHLYLLTPNTCLHEPWNYRA